MEDVVNALIDVLWFRWSVRQRRNFVVLLAIFIGFIGVAILYGGPEQGARPCSAERYPGRCYRITETLCETIWRSAEKFCKAGVAKLALPPTQLIGPTILKCEVAYLDKIVGASHADDNEDCRDRRRELADWKKMNPELLQPQ